MFEETIKEIQNIPDIRWYYRVVTNFVTCDNAIIVKCEKDLHRKKISQCLYFVLNSYVSKLDKANMAKQNG